MAESDGGEEGHDIHPDWTLDEWTEIRPLLMGTAWGEYGPFGLHGNLSGREALRLLDRLGVDGSGFDPQRPADGDSAVFERLREFDTGLKFIEPHPDLEGGEIGKLHRLFEDVHVALPFTEGERRWMYRVKLGDRVGSIDSLAGQTDKIMESGVMREINGRDLLSLNPPIHLTDRRIAVGTRLSGERRRPEGVSTDGELR